MFDWSGDAWFAVHGGGDSAGISGMVESLLAGIENLLAAPAGELLPSLLPGVAAMENIHPLFVHFPIALLTVFFLIDLAGSLSRNPDWRYAANWFLYSGAVFAGMAVIAGLFAASTVEHGDDVHEIMETHEHLGLTIFGLAAILSAWRLMAKDYLQGPANWLYLFFAALLCVLLAFAADFGGLMVYKYGVAVAPARALLEAAPDVHRHEHDHDHDHSD